MLEVRQVSKYFSNHQALNKVNVSVPEGSIYGLLGPNGAGKTTLIRIINQITAPDEGEVFFHGRHLKSSDIKNIGYLPEERGLYKKMKVGEQAVYLAQLKGLSQQEATKRLRQWFEKFDILQWWDKKVEELSKGMQQKIQFIITVVHKPALLIFDEPFSGFDPINANLLKDEILELRNNGATIIFSTHNMASVEELCDHITLINRSKNILEGEFDKLQEQFRDNTFEIITRIKPEFNAFSKENSLEIIEQVDISGKVITKLRIGESGSSSNLIREVINQTELLSFREILPGMNEIFIQQVAQNEKQVTV